MNPAVVSQLRELLAEVRPQLANQALGPDDDIVRTLGLDSLDVANLLVEIEVLWGVQVDLASLADLTTLNKLAAYVVATGVSLDHKPVAAGRGGEELMT